MRIILISLCDLRVKVNAKFNRSALLQQMNGNESKMKKEALHYKKLGDNCVQCQLCPHECKLKPEQLGICGVRQNIEGTLYSLVYAQPIAMHVDPIEKKPLFHVLPGSQSFSLATVGCNFHCVFCQNSDISQVSGIRHLPRTTNEVSPGEIVRMARSQGCQSIAYTYTEPTVYYEYALDCCRLAHEEHIVNVFVSNGYINPEPLKEISSYLDAANVDLKSFREAFYRRLIGAKLAPVLDALKWMKKLNIWVEVTTLVIPTHNDSHEELRDIARFIKNELGEETPWHISRYYPHFRMNDIPPTPVSTLQKAREIGLSAGLRYVYTGNVMGDEGESTYCHRCGKALLRRYGFSVLENHIIDSKCKFCQAHIDGIGLG